jgi:SpoIID/LytB domain protein
LKNIGEPIQLLPTKRNPSGHLSTLKIIGTKGEFELRRELEIRKKLFSGLFKSARFTILSVTGKNQDYLVFVGSGFGHGVGLCQEGACGMAKKGWPFEKILKFYYQDSIIKRIDF